MNTYKVTGIMSGTSLDGVDLAYCSFWIKEGKWNFTIEKAETIPYPPLWKDRLSNLETQSALDFTRTDSEYGHYLGRITKKFHANFNLMPDFVASHGHTIFHQPGSKFTSQIGKGSAIAAETGIPVICDFRSTDVALGGQGAPLVPIGDHYLFEKYSFCLNLGGFANISYAKSGGRIAFDICPANIVLNHLTASLHLDYDENGDLAKAGNLDQTLLEELNKLQYYHRQPPKSLGKEWVIENVFPILERYKIPSEDKLRTYVEHISYQVAKAISQTDSFTMLITGGGAFNTFLIERIHEKTGIVLVLPDPLIINFKEALIFAFLGVLRWRNEINCLKSYTGASHDNIGGAIYQI